MLDTNFSKKVLLSALLIVLLCFPGALICRAQETGTSKDVNVQETGSNMKQVITLQNPLKVNSIGELVQNFVEIFSYIVILGAVLALIWVGLQFILARGNPAKMTELKDWLKWIIIGVAVVIGARLIIQVVINTLAASGAVDQRTIQSAQNAAKGQ